MNLLKDVFEMIYFDNVQKNKMIKLSEEHVKKKFIYFFLIVVIFNICFIQSSCVCAVVLHVLFCLYLYSALTFSLFFSCQENILYYYYCFLRFVFYLLALIFHLYSSNFICFFFFFNVFEKQENFHVLYGYWMNIYIQKKNIVYINM